MGFELAKNHVFGTLLAIWGFPFECPFALFGDSLAGKRLSARPFRALYRYFERGVDDFCKGYHGKFAAL